MIRKIAFFWEDYGSTIIFVIIAVLVVSAVVYGAMMFSKVQCTATTSDIGYPSRWSAIGMCQIEVEPGMWILLDNYRYDGNR